VIIEPHECVRWYQDRGAFSEHDGKSANIPHPILTTGLHSSKYCNSAVVLQDSRLTYRLCQSLRDRLDRRMDTATIHRVVGPETGGRTVASMLALAISNKHDTSCLWSFTKKVEVEGGELAVVFGPTAVKEGEIVLICDDVITKGSAVLGAAHLVKSHGGTTVPFFAAFLDQSLGNEVEGREIVSNFERPLPAWEKKDCPYCDLGSPALRPKENWQLFQKIS
jgi:orotate phosphoribosyltransferase